MVKLEGVDCHANRELQTLAGQVEATARCLVRVATLLDDPEIKAFHTEKLSEDTHAVSVGCHDVFLELDKAVKRIGVGGGRLSAIARLQWPLDSSVLTEPLKVLRNYNDGLHLMLAVLQIVEGRRAAYAALGGSQTPLYADPMDRFSDELRALETSLQGLTLLNEKLSESNKTLTDLLYSREHSRKNLGDADAFASLAVSSDERTRDEPRLDPSMANLAFPSWPASTRLIWREAATIAWPYARPALTMHGTCPRFFKIDHFRHEHLARTGKDGRL